MLDLIVFGYPALGLAIGGLYVALLRRRAARYALGLLALFMVWAVFLAFYTVYNMGGGFGAGTLLLCFSFLSVAVLALALLFWRRKTFALLPDDVMVRRLYWGGALLLLLGQGAPFVGVFGIAEACDAQNYAIAAPIQAALQAYQDDTGAYPDDLAALVPDYLDALPAPACFAPYDWAIFGGNSSRSAAHYTLERCRTGETLITWPGLTGVSVERINVETGNGGGVSFLDGTCSYLP